MRLWVGDHVRNPDQYSEEREHKSHEAYREPRMAMDEYGNGGECESDGSEDCPKHLAGRDPLWNQSGCIAKKERLAQRKGNRADAKSNARHAAERSGSCSVRLRRREERNRAAKHGEEQEEAASEAIIDVRRGKDVRNASQRKRQVDGAEDERSQTRGPRELQCRCQRQFARS